jgi:ribosomal protein S21
MHYLVLKVLEDENFEHANGRRMLDAWMKAKDLFENMSQEERDEIEKKVKRKLL